MSGPSTPAGARTPGATGDGAADRRGDSPDNTAPRTRASGETPQVATCVSKKTTANTHHEGCRAVPAMRSPAPKARRKPAHPKDRNDETQTDEAGRPGTHRRVEETPTSKKRDGGPQEHLQKEKYM